MEIKNEFYVRFDRTIALIFFSINFCFLLAFARMKKRKKEKKKRACIFDNLRKVLKHRFVSLSAKVGRKIRMTLRLVKKT